MKDYYTIRKQEGFKLENRDWRVFQFTVAMCTDRSTCLYAINLTHLLGPSRLGRGEAWLGILQKNREKRVSVSNILSVNVD